MEPMEDDMRSIAFVLLVVCAACPAFAQTGPTLPTTSFQLVVNPATGEIVGTTTNPPIGQPLGSTTNAADGQSFLSASTSPTITNTLPALPFERNRLDLATTNPFHLQVGTSIGTTGLGTISGPPLPNPTSPSLYPATIAGGSRSSGRAFASPMSSGHR